MIHRLVQTFLLFALAGWLAGVVVLGLDEDRTLLGSLFLTDALRSGAIGAVLGLPMGLVLPRLRQWYWGALAGLLSVPCGVWLFFALWPPQWKVPTWKASAILMKSYWFALLPAGLIAGGVAVLLCTWRSRAAAWIEPARQSG